VNKGLQEPDLYEEINKTREHNISQREKSSRYRRRRRPLSVFSKIVIAALLSMSILWGALSIALRQTNLFMVVLILLLVSGLMAIGIRWAPLLGSFLCGAFLAVFLFGSSFPLYHLAHPRDAYGPGSPPWLAYGFFVGIVILFWCMVASLLSGVAAVIQNYFLRDPGKPRWFTPALTASLGVLCGAIMLGAFAPPPQSTQATTTNGVLTVHLMVSNFAQTSITLPKGSKLLIVDDGSFKHNLNNGEWVNGQPQPENQPAAPVVKNQTLQNAGQSLEIGPFTISGTYHIYCSIHVRMMLTIIVQ